MQAERAWLAWVRRRAASAATRAEVRLGIGDDAALLRPRPGWDLAMTTDLLIEGVHFLRRHDPAASCGRRLATRALSDLAAMGAEPLALLVSSAYPADLPAAWPRQFYRGLLAATAEAGAQLAGGDASASPGRAGKIFFDVVGVGQAPANRALRRSGARAGDRVWVSGVLGEAARGRELAHRGLSVRTAADRRARARHFHPRARWELGMVLRGVATAALDLSDGLATDLGHLCRESGVGAELEAARIPALATDRDLRLALGGGEDYELLFTVPPRRRMPVVAGLREIGVITAAPGLWLRHPNGRRQRLPASGWQHWAR